MQGIAVGYGSTHRTLFTFEKKPFYPPSFCMFNLFLCPLLMFQKPDPWRFATDPYHLMIADTNPDLFFRGLQQKYLITLGTFTYTVHQSSKRTCYLDVTNCRNQVFSWFICLLNVYWRIRFWICTVITARRGSYIYKFNGSGTDCPFPKIETRDIENTHDTTPFSLVFRREYFDCPERYSHEVHYI